MTEYIEVHSAENVHELNGGYRFWFSIFAIVRYDEVWTLVHGQTGEPLLHRDDRGEVLVMLWPSLGTAEAFASAEAREYNPRPISLHRFLEDGLVEFIRLKFRISPCPAPNEPFVSCPADAFAKYVEMARGLGQLTESMESACTLSTEGDCGCPACLVAGKAQTAEPRLACALRMVGGCTLWTVRREWLWFEDLNADGHSVFCVWDSKQAVEQFIAQWSAEEKKSVHVAGIPLTDWLYFWTGWLARKEFRLRLNGDAEQEIAPLVFDRLLRGTFTRVTGRDLPKCY